MAGRTQPGSTVREVGGGGRDTAWQRPAVGPEARQRQGLAEQASSGAERSTE